MITISATSAIILTDDEARVLLMLIGVDTITRDLIHQWDKHVSGLVKGSDVVMELRRELRRRDEEADCS